MKLFTTALSIVMVMSLCLTPSAKAGVDINFGASVQLNDRSDLYFSISSNYFNRDRDTLERWGAQFRDPDDLAVALFISGHSERALGEIWKLRHQRRMTWWEISAHYGMSIDVWFVNVKHDPGPPYGKAYGHYKKHKQKHKQKHKHDDHATIVLTDFDVRNLVAVRVAHEYYGVSIETAMEWRIDGTNLRDLMSDQYEKRHGKPYHASKVTKAAKNHPGKGKNKKH
jgi:hypothetical protein